MLNKYQIRKRCYKINTLVSTLIENTTNFVFGGHSLSEMHQQETISIWEYPNILSVDTVNILENYLKQFGYKNDTYILEYLVSDYYNNKLARDANFIVLVSGCLPSIDECMLVTILTRSKLDKILIEECHKSVIDLMKSDIKKLLSGTFDIDELFKCDMDCKLIRLNMCCGHPENVQISPVNLTDIKNINIPFNACTIAAKWHNNELFVYISTNSKQEIKMEPVIKEYYTADIKYNRYLADNEEPQVTDSCHKCGPNSRYESLRIIIPVNDVITACEVFRDMYPYLHENSNLINIESIALNSHSPILMFDNK